MDPKKSKNSPRIKVIQKLYNSLMNPDAVIEFRKQHGLRGMSVLQFGFSGDIATNPHYPENVTEDQIVYTGTHDNNTAL